MGDLEKIQPRLSKSDFFALRGRNGLSLRNPANEGRADAIPLCQMESIAKEEANC